MNSFHLNDLERTNPQAFEKQADQIVEEAEKIRLRLMGAHSRRKGIYKAVLIITVTLGASAFGWFLLVQGRIDLAVISMLGALIPPILISFWAESPAKNYRSVYKQEFMPKFAKLLGGFRFFPARGISANIVTRAGILPRHEVYKAEDCFMGVYKGVKVIFSEARLYRDKKATKKAFSGIFVLLEIPSDIFEGHTILSADKEMVERYSVKRWNSLKNVPLDANDPNAVSFQMYSDAPEAASLLVGSRLLKELAEAGAVFDNAPITAVFFRKKYIFVTIPYDHDMFEAYNLEVPVKTKKHAMQCKREIEQILEIIDVFEIYKSSSSS